MNKKSETVRRAYLNTFNQMCQEFDIINIYELDSIDELEKITDTVAVLRHKKTEHLFNNWDKDSKWAFVNNGKVLCWADTLDKNDIMYDRVFMK